MIECTVNGKAVSVADSPDASLLWLLPVRSEDLRTA